METKVCKHCGKEQPIEKFYTSSKNHDGYQSYCKDCQKELNKQRTKKKAYEAEKAKNEAIVANFLAGGPDTPEVQVKPKPIIKEDKGDKVLTEDGRVLTKIKMLGDYTSRELLEEIKRRGYVWDKMWIKQNIDYNKIKI